MKRRVFTNCLNMEAKIFNFAVGGVISCVLFAVIFGLWRGLFYGLGGGAVGYMAGCFLSKQWFTGQLQRKIYRYLPWAKLFIDKNMPESHYCKLM